MVKQKQIEFPRLGITPRQIVGAKTPIMDPFSGAPYTRSQEAKASLKDALPKLQGKVLAWLQARGKLGGTCDELELATNLRHQTASARVNELGKMGKIVPAGKRKTRSGRNATVWVVAP